QLRRSVVDGLLHAARAMHRADERHEYRLARRAVRTLVRGLGTAAPSREHNRRENRRADLTRCHRNVPPRVPAILPPRRQKPGLPIWQAHDSAIRRPSDRRASRINGGTGMTSAADAKHGSFDPIKLVCWVGIAAYVVMKLVLLSRGATLGELFD